MRPLIATLLVLASATYCGFAPANAASARSISHYSTATMSCADIQSRIHDEGAVVLRYPSNNPAAPRYGRYVDSRHYCTTDEVATPTSLPAADTQSCRVMVCVYAR